MSSFEYFGTQILEDWNMVLEDRESVCCAKPWPTIHNPSSQNPLLCSVSFAELKIGDTKDIKRPWILKTYIIYITYITHNQFINSLYLILRHQNLNTSQDLNIPAGRLHAPDILQRQVLVSGAPVSCETMNMIQEVCWGECRTGQLCKATSMSCMYGSWL